MNQELFQPSLSPGEQLQSYNVQQLYTVAFFGGVLPTIVLGVRNARWLKLEKWKINLLIALSIPAFILEAAAVGLAAGSMGTGYDRSRRPLNTWAIHSLALILAYVFVKMLKTKYIGFLSLDGEVRPLVKDAVIWGVVGGIVELLVVVGVLARV